jgi:NAD(P)-dependent dehydrogenase (short-subunit alcohol dehydrogenase family)
MELNGSRVLVTGASGGIGQALVEQLCRAGAQVLAVGRDADGSRPRGALSARAAPRRRRSRHAPPASMRWLPRRGPRRRRLRGPGRRPQPLRPRRAAGRRGHRAQVALNLVAPMLLTRRLLPLLRERPRALLLFVGSTFGAIGYPGFAPYSATKFGSARLRRGAAPRARRRPGARALPGAARHAHRDERERGGRR